MLEVFESKPNSDWVCTMTKSQLWGTKNRILQVQLVWGKLGMKISTKWHNFHLGSMSKKWLKPSEQIDQSWEIIVCLCTNWPNE